MRIGHVTATYPPYLGGTGNVAFHNARSLGELGHDVTVYTARIAGTPATERNGFTVRRLRTPLRIGNAPLLPGLLGLGRHDLLHLHYPFIFGSEMVLALSRLRGQPYVLTYHNDLVSPGLKGSLFSIYERVWTPRVMEGARRIIVTSWDSASASPVLGPIVRARPDRVREVPNGIDTTVFRPLADSVELRGRLGLRSSHRVIAFVGSMDSAHHPKGGVPILLEAAARLRDDGLVILLAGGGDRVAEYQGLAARLGLQSQARFLGRVPNEDLPFIYGAADVVVQPSVLFEPFGLVAIEAMACGRPVIVSDLPGVRRVVSEAGGGVLSPPGDSAALAAMVGQLLADPALRARLGSIGRAGVEARYDWSRIGPMLVATYEEVLAVS